MNTSERLALLVEKVFRVVEAVAFGLLAGTLGTLAVVELTGTMRWAAVFMALLGIRLACDAIARYPKGGPE